MGDAVDGLMLLQLPQGPMLLPCYFCEAYSLFGEYLVAADLEELPSAVCGSCAGEIGPELAACVQALNVIAATAGDLAPQHGLRLVCALIDQISRWWGPTVALLNVNPMIVERINES